MEKITGRATSMTQAEATERGYFTMPILDVIKAESLPLDDFNIPTCYFETELFCEIEGIPDFCPNCGEEIEKDWHHPKFCQACGEDLRIYEHYKTRKEAEKSENASLGITDMVSFWIKVRPVAAPDLELKG